MKYFLFIFLLLLPMSLFAQNNTELYAKEWRKADSLQQRGMPESAAKIATAIYAKAKMKNQQVQMMKAQLFLMGTGFERSEDRWKDLIEQSDSLSRATAFPENAIWKSITAELYWQYYSQNRWQIMNRTKLATNVPNPDFELWDTDRFYTTIAKLFQSSITRAKELEQINIKQYAVLLSKAINSESYRPTLYDLLVFRALSFFENDEKDLTKPAFAFTINDEIAFAPAMEFAQHRFRTNDTNALQYQALEIYQRLLQLHSNDEVKDAYLDADLQRLQFVYNHSTATKKKGLYAKALNNFSKANATHPLAALAIVSALQVQQEENNSAHHRGTNGKENTSRNLTALKKSLEQVIAKYPSTEGAALAQNRLNDILAKSIQLTIEEVVLPQEPSKILVTYKNTPRLSLRIVRVAETLLEHDNNTEKHKAKLLSSNPIYTEQFSLPATEDLHQHSTEIKINALEKGNYAVIVSANESFSSKDNIIQYAVFQVSALSTIQANERGYVLNRKTGTPIANATVLLYKNEYDYNNQRNKTTLIKSLQTANDGHYNLSLAQVYNYTMKLIANGDTLETAQYYQGRNGYNSPNHRQTFFFTDRAIYRPGQTIYYKGIMVQVEDAGRKNKVLANEKTEISFYDVNNTKIASSTFTTNEFGSFTGTFTAPQGVLTGNMHIGNDNGGVYFSVEEYKRPKFFVEIDTLKNAVALNDKVSLKGKAMAYAGNAVDNAKVKYRVVRNTRFPYWWYAYRWGFPQSEQMEIANGETITDKDGLFKIDFIALPDETVNPESLPIFSYSITTDVVDINGETRTGNSTIEVGYTALQIVANMPTQIVANDIDKITITTKNLNNVFVATPMQLKVSRLQSPAIPLRNRLWQMPDQYLMDSTTFKQYFPTDVYKNEDDKINWPIAETIFTHSFQTKADGSIAPLSTLIHTSGWYVFEMTIKDKNGKELTEKKYAEIMVKGQANTTKPLTILAAQTQLQPNEKAQLTLLSAYNNLYVLQIVDDASYQTKWNQINLDGKPKVWELQITEAQRGGMAINYATVKNNRFYTEEVYLSIPWSNKELNISWETHRDKLQPNEKEKWTMVVLGEKKEKIAAELMATLYDASLDALRPHSWRIQDLYPSFYANKDWKGLNFGTKIGIGIVDIDRPDFISYEKVYATLNTPIIEGRYDLRFMASDGVALSGESYKAKTMAAPVSIAGARKEANQTLEGAVVEQEAISNIDAKKNEQQTIQPRKNLQETAFFLPQLRTDANGNIIMEFTMPEALTEWKLMALAHTKNMRIGTLEGKVKTQKDLMVIPNLPRFFRQGDEMNITTKISNLSDKELAGVATLTILNAATLQPLNIPFRLQQSEQTFTVAKGQSTTATWRVHIPESIYEPVVVRITARAGNFTDGEENTLPVITNRILVTETLPMWMNGNGTKKFNFDKLKASANSASLAQHALTIEYTSNPAWYAVQALPYLMEYPYECAEQTFNRYYATALAAHIIQQSPKIKAIFDRWNLESKTASFTSPLTHNEELKTALLEETPWVMEAINETEQRKNIAQLFDTYKLANELEATTRKLKDMQLSNGAFSWFKGMYEDRYITQYIITGIGRLQQLGVAISQKDMQEIVSKALPYLDGEMKRSYDQLLRNKIKMEEQHISYHDAQFLYMRSFFAQEMPYPIAYQYYQKQAAKFWPSFNPYIKGMLAIAMYRNDDKKTAKDIIQSLRETAIHKEELGMYWKPSNSYWWYEAPIESQALLIEAFKVVANDDKAIDEMRRWLLKHKQTNNWHTTKATADACYALLLTGTDWLLASPELSITLGSKTITSKDQKQESGSGYFKERIAGENIKPAMGNITLNIANTQQDKSNKNPTPNQSSWGAVYWQYFEDMDKVSEADKQIGITISKQLFIEKNTARGKELIPFNAVVVGDRIIARIVINVDRDMDYVHLKDMRAACFEPVNILSGYKWNNGLGYYESTKDISTNFFFDHLRKGKYVFEYPVNVSQKGTFSNGIATIQCMYAPEFSNHSAGEIITIP